MAVIKSQLHLACGRDSRRKHYDKPSEIIKQYVGVRRGKYKYLQGTVW